VIDSSSHLSVTKVDIRRRSRRRERELNCSLRRLRVPFSATAVSIFAFNLEPLKLSISGVDWAKNGQTLVLAISSTCHYCSESAPFYQRLARERGDIRMLAVLPQPVEEGRRYLEKLGVEVDDVKQASLASMGVSGTPTLILVNKDGAVENSWVGKLPTVQETEVLGSLQKN
jgi:hypothetical protein